MSDHLQPLSDHPLVRPFWAVGGRRLSRNASLTLDDYVYTVRLDGTPSVDVLEERVSYYDSSVTSSRRIRGTWTALRVRTDLVVLRLEGVDDAGRTACEGLVLTPGDIELGPMEWVEKHFLREDP